METVSLKMEKNLLKDIDKTIKAHRYSTRTEFIRDSIQSATIKQRCRGLQELIKQINKIGVNLNQIAKHVNENKVIDQFALNGINETFKQLSAIIQRFNQ